jgi:hypothetical protein
VRGESTRVSQAAMVSVHTKKYFCADRCGGSRSENGSSVPSDMASKGRDEVKQGRSWWRRRDHEAASGDAGFEYLHVIVGVPLLDLGPGPGSAPLHCLTFATSAISQRMASVTIVSASCSASILCTVGPLGMAQLGTTKLTKTSRHTAFFHHAS